MKDDNSATPANMATAMKVNSIAQKGAADKAAVIANEPTAASNAVTVGANAVKAHGEIAASVMDATDMVATVANVTTAAGFVEDGKSHTAKDRSNDMRTPLVLLMVIPHTCKGLPPSCVGLTTPYVAHLKIPTVRETPGRRQAPLPSRRRCPERLGGRVREEGKLRCH